MFSECIDVSREVVIQDPKKRIEELARLNETIEGIEKALLAEDFNHGDKREVTRSKEFFEGRKKQLERSLAEHSIISTQQAF